MCSTPACPLDEQRDGLTLPLIRRALQRGGTDLRHLPAACRKSTSRSADRCTRPSTACPANATTARLHPRHRNPIRTGTHCFGASRRRARRILGEVDITVNSLHGQGIRTLAPGLRAEALSPDGVVEAFSPSGPKASVWVCNGTPSGAPPRTRCHASFSPHLARPARITKTATAPAALSCSCIHAAVPSPSGHGSVARQTQQQGIHMVQETIHLQRS